MKYFLPYVVAVNVLLLCTALPISASAVLNTIDANTVVEKAIDNHPLVQSARSEAKATDEGVTAARLGRFPTLTVNSDLGKDGPTATVNVQQSLWSAGRLDASIDQANYDTYAARATVEEQRYEIGKRALEAWQVFVSSANLKGVYRTNLNELDRFQSMMRRRVRAQVSARIELDLVMNRILQSQDAYDAANEQQRIGLSRLEQIIGEPISKGVMARSYDLKEMAARVRRESRSFNQSMIDKASHTHPSVVKAAYQARAAQSAADVEKSATLPQLVARYQHQYVRDTDTKTDQVLLGFQYAPGAGFSSYALARAAQERVDAIKQTQEAARRQVVEDLQVDYQQFASARDRERALMAAVNGARIVKESYERQFIAGRKSWLDVLNAVREEETYAAQLVQARVSFIAAYYRLKLGIGLLPWQKSAFKTSHKTTDIQDVFQSSESIAVKSSAATAEPVKPIRHMTSKQRPKKVALSPRSKPKQQLMAPALAKDNVIQPHDRIETTKHADTANQTHKTKKRLTQAQVRALNEQVVQYQMSNWQ